jgi:hypothetical protein
MKRLKKLFIFLLNSSLAQLDTQPRVNSVNGNLRFEPGNGKDILFVTDQEGFHAIFVLQKN